MTSIGEEAFSNCFSLTSITIPNSVTSIGDWAFYNCSSLTSITIPNSVTSIGNDAFLNCFNLKAVHITDIAAWCKIEFGSSSSNPLTEAHHLYLNGEKVKDLVIPNSVTSIGNYAFSGCSSLTSVTIPNSVTSIGDWAFQYCSSLTSITLPNSVTSIGERAFLYCKGLTSITLPNSVTSIGDWAFYYCSSLTSITIPNSVTSIGSEAFYECSKLKAVHITDIAAWCKIEFGGDYSNPLTRAHHLYLNGEKVKDLVIPNSVTSIGNYAFSGCSSLTSVTIPNSVTSIGDWAFQYCSSLTSITLPNSVTSIGSYAFLNCSSLTSITLPNSVTSIGNEAFSNCSSLKAVHITDIAAWCKIEFGSNYSNPLTDAHHLYLNGEEVKDLVIPNSVTSIGDWTFLYCSSLTSVTLPNSVTSIGSYAFSYCKGLTSITIPNSVTSIGWGAFFYCSGLTSITIPNSVTSIENYAFANCEMLTDVYCYAEKVPDTESDVFDDSYIEYSTLHVPASALDSYKAWSPWKGFGTIKSLEGGDQPEEPEEPEVKICATPTISYIDGKLVFACETEGAEFISEITCDDIRKHYEAEVPLTTTYTVTVRATKVGYDDSETTTATLCWIECTHEDEEGDDSDALTTIPAMRLLVQAQPGGVITLQGATSTLPVAIFTTSGTQVASGTMEPDATLSLATGLSAGEVAIVKLGAKSVKVMVE